MGRLFVFAFAALYVTAVVTVGLVMAWCVVLDVRDRRRRRRVEDRRDAERWAVREAFTEIVEREFAGDRREFR